MMRTTAIGDSFASFFSSTMRGIEWPRVRYVGDGQERASERLKRHREKQAARVEPAIWALDGKRWLIADARVDRWQRKGRDLDKAPGHILEKAREVGMRK